ncbi:MAG: ACT domain-containing protein, partial [Alicyclobacillus sp.]|nr:ACT domain-containing protein [Alicyclobacillus sp.]
TLVTSATAVLESSALTDRYVTGITQAAPFAQLTVTGERLPHSRVFADTARHGISLDFILVTPTRISYTVHERQLDEAVAVLRDLGLEPHVVPDCARVAVVGAGIAGVPGIMAKVVCALADEGIDILQSADSHTTIWCLVRRTHMEAAVRALHRAFELGR